MGMQEQTLAVQRMQAYIDAHLFGRITLADLAGACHYSPWYAYRLFTQWLRRTPAEYIRKLRLTRSAWKLRETGRTVADVAFAVGFQSVDGYQRAFHAEFGCNPSQYAARPMPLYLFPPYPPYLPNEQKENHMNSTSIIFVQPMAKPERTVLIKRGIQAADYMQYCEEVGCDIWGYLTSVPNALEAPMGLWMPSAMTPQGTSSYVQGVALAASAGAQIPEGFDLITLPAATYLQFQGEPFAEEDYAEAIDTVWAAIRKYDPAQHGYEWDASQPRIQLEPIGSRGYIEWVPVRPL